MRTMFTPVTIYTQPGCRPCHRVQEKLEEAGIDYDVVDLTRNEEARTYVTDVLKAASVPVIVTDVRDPIIGYQPDEVKDLITFLTASETGL
ncbi:NrdH-like glutaredoxin [Mycobacterium phage Pharaoh]|uniref:NrdH-like glutaredoxin n=1 Tax=Mycobacterium phage Pharaoh TaxID=2530140 RepID=A0A481W2T7_9CAUD|nr:thioredoxin domain [Mycobacterium phage Pharaoh]QBJ00242.1 NrdH-like glutaredoxin [Mycobacterium phage Pharaoh]